MNREELIKLLQSWLTTATDDNGNPIHVIMDVDIHEIATEIIKSSIPPAEGAEDFLKNDTIFDLLKCLGWKIPSIEKPEIGKEYWVRWNPNTENEDYKGKQITKGFPVSKEGYCIYGITHYKEI